MKKNKALVSIIMGSDSDWPTMQPAADVLKDFNISHEVKIVSAHRTPRAMQRYAMGCHKRGIKVIIAGTSGAAHLPGMVASLTPLPVIGVPLMTMTKKLKGLDSLLSIVQMPKGVPVATVAVDNAYNSALLAARILSVSKPALTKKMMDYMNQRKKATKAKKIKL